MHTLCATLSFGGQAALSDLLGRAGVQAHEESNALVASRARTRACSKSAAATAAKQRHIKANAFRASSVLQRSSPITATMLPLPPPPPPPLPPSPLPRPSTPSTKPLQPAPLVRRWPKLLSLQTPRPPPLPIQPRLPALSSQDAAESRAALGPIGMEAYAELLDAAGLRLGALCACRVVHILCACATYTQGTYSEHAHAHARQVCHPAAQGARRTDAHTAGRGGGSAKRPRAATRNAARPPRPARVPRSEPDRPPGTMEARWRRGRRREAEGRVDTFLPARK